MAILFNWTNAFETGLAAVDEQHKYLVSLINELGALVLGDSSIDQQVFANYYHALLDYTRFHFAEEMANMQALNLDKRHLETHGKEHLGFIEELQGIDPQQPISNEQLQDLLSDLTNWLAYHILGTDQSMARQIDFMKQGLTSDKAYEEDAYFQSRSSEPLLAALRVLYQTVLERNRNLQSINKELDKRVRQRTAELEESNAKLGEANEKLHRQTIIDELTQLYNRRFALVTLEKLWAAWCRHGTPLSILVMDIDKFKPVNDCFGHAAGDALLLQLAQHFSSAIRASDYVCRMGGDEFLIICPESDLEGATKLANKVLATQQPFSLNSGEICWHGGISIGIAQASVDMKSYDELLGLADEALYISKRDGGNTFTLHTQIEST